MEDSLDGRTFEAIVERVRERLEGYEGKAGYNRALRHLKGQTDRVPTDFLVVVADVLDVSLEWLVAGRGSRQRRPPEVSDQLLDEIEQLLAKGRPDKPGET